MVTDLSFSSANHRQTNGQTEGTNQSLEQYLRCYVSSNQLLWAVFLPWAELVLAYNNSITIPLTRPQMDVSSFFTVFGYNPRAFSF